MLNKKLRMSYLVSGVLFLFIAILGARYFQWGALSFAFLLLTYLIVIIGIRLDEMSERLAEIQALLARQNERDTRP